jgi:RNA polymerase sigma-70 factor (ECF subfamily)
MDNLYQDEKILLCRISTGDERAFKLVFEHYYKKVYRFALKVVKNPATGEDILHDVFIKIWQHADLRNIENLEHYLMVATRNQALKVLRKQQLEIRVNNEMVKSWDETHNETEESIFLHESENLLEQAIKLLPPRQQAVYKLCHQEGLKYHEVAKLLSLSPLTVKTHMQYALRFLRSFLIKNGNVNVLLLLTEILFQKK